MDPEVDIVRRLYEVTYEAGVACIRRSRQCSLVWACRYQGRPRSKGLVLEHGWDATHILAIDRAEIEVLVAEAEKDFAPPDRASAIAHNRPEAFVGGRRKCLQRWIVDKVDARRRRSDWRSKRGA